MPQSAKLHTHQDPTPAHMFPRGKSALWGGGCVALVIIFDPCTAINVAHKIDNKLNWDTHTRIRAGRLPTV